MIKNRTIFTGDNLPIMRGMDGECVDLIYLDPPFNSNKYYEAPIGSRAAGASFKDAWTLNDTDDAWWGEIADRHPALYKVIDAIGATGGGGAKGYSIYMAIRLLEMHRILKPKGSIYLHCDPTMSHSLKLVMDAIWGRQNFRNEIVWCYKSGGASPKRYFSKKHDVILFYAKTKEYLFNKQEEKSYNRGLKPYRFKGVKEYLDQTGWHTLVGMKDYWNIDVIGRTSGERTDYPTQKPLALLQRIVKASSNRDNVVFDPFCGCATACVASELEGRQWIVIDISELAFSLVKQRLERKMGVSFFDLKIIHRTDIPRRVGDKTPKDKDTKHKLFGKQEGLCNGCLHPFPYRNFTLDHIIPQAHGGGEEAENFQLLCGACNSRKGTETMEHLIVKLKQERIR